jgi:hypothetical protein
MGTASSFNVQYNIPKVNLSLPGRQHRGGNGEIRVTPGMTETFEFVFGNFDGIPLNLSGFTIRWLFWIDIEQYDNLPTTLAADGIVLYKDVIVTDAFSGRTTVVLSEDDTFKIGRSERGSVNWSMYMINGDGQIFPVQVSSSGSRTGSCRVERMGGLTSEKIRSLSLDK